MPTTVSYSSLQRTVEQHVDIPVPGGGGSVSGLHGFLPRQRSTASPSRKRISERIVEQIVDPVSRGGLHGSTSHSPAGDEERTDEPGKGVFRTFPQIKKVRRLLRTRGRNCLRTPAHGRRRLSWRTPSSGCGSGRKTLARRTSGTDVLTVQSGELHLVLRSCGTAKWMRREGSGTGTGTRVSPRLTSLLGEELYRQPRAVFKYWAGGLPSCGHAATCSSSSSSFKVGMDQKGRCSGMYKAGIVGHYAPRAVFFPGLAGPECSAFWPVRTRRTVAVAWTMLVLLVILHLALCSLPWFALRPVRTRRTVARGVQAIGFSGR